MTKFPISSSALTANRRKRETISPNGQAGPTHCQEAPSLDGRIEAVPVDQLIPYAGNARKHSRQQVAQIAASIQRFGFLNPVLVDDRDVVIAGHGRVAAAKLLGLKEVPVLRISHLSAAEKKGYVLADNRLAEKAGWHRELLAIELKGLIDLNFEVELVGFEADEIEFILDNVGSPDDGSKKGREAARDKSVLPKPHHGRPVTEAGDVWLMGKHRLVSGEAVDDGYAVDAAIRCWQAETGKAATLAATGQTFTTVEERRRANTAGSDQPTGAALGGF
jgi:hypothetical protein